MSIYGLTAEEVTFIQDFMNHINTSEVTLDEFMSSSYSKQITIEAKRKRVETLQAEIDEMDSDNATD